MDVNYDATIRLIDLAHQSDKLISEGARSIPWEFSAKIVGPV